MSEYPYQSDATLQTYEIETEMLRGYDPSKESLRWNIVVAFLVGEASVCVLAIMPAFSSPSMLSWGSPWLIAAMIALLLLLSIAAPLMAYLLYRNNNKKKKVSRQAALREVYHLVYPFSPPQPFSLPLQIKSRVKMAYVRRMIILMLPALALFVCYGVITFGHLEELPGWLIAFPGIIAPMMMMIFCMGGPLMVQGLITNHYGLPAMVVDNDGMSACYGRDPIFMRWHDIRYLAVARNTESMWSTTRKSAASSALNREVYEISDGENMICWLREAPFSSHRLLQNGEVALSDQQYTKFAQQLASLVIERTGLPLYDFRPPERKAKKV
jgi:hypothetical protein